MRGIEFCKVSYTNDIKKRWADRIPTLDDYASQLLDLSNDIISSDILPYERYGFHLGAMVDAFCHKQIDHLKSICILVKAEQYNDAQIICRSSIESLYLLLWSAYGPKDKPGEVRPIQWFAYEGIEGYRKIMRDVSYELDFNYETIIFQIVNDYGYLFLTDKAKRNKHKSNQWDDDPFIKRWPPNNSEIIDELKELGLLNPELQYYEGLYKNYCQWMHGIFKDLAKCFAILRID